MTAVVEPASASDLPEWERQFLEEQAARENAHPTGRRLRFDPDALYVALDRQRRSRRLKWRQVAAEVGVSASGFSRLAVGRRPDVDSLVAMLGWLGTTDLYLFLVPAGEASST